MATTVGCICRLIWLAVGVCGAGATADAAGECDCCALGEHSDSAIMSAVGSNLANQ